MYRLMLFSTLAIVAQIPHRTHAKGEGVSAESPYFESYQSLGCWKDGIPRAIPSLEGKSDKLDGKYKMRQSAVNKCRDAAIENDSEVFAVQDGGQCFGGPNATNTYKKYGTETTTDAKTGKKIIDPRNCHSMKGGAMFNDVYQLSPLKKCLCLLPKKEENLPDGKTCFKNETITNKDGRTALHVAALTGDAKCTKILIGAGANVDAMDNNNETAMQLAQCYDKCESVKVLLDKNATQGHLCSQHKGPSKCIEAVTTSAPETAAQNNPKPTSDKYVEKPGAEGCGQATIPESECKNAAKELKYESANGYKVYNLAHLPHGCFVGHASTQWTYTYYNSNAGTKNAAFKSICKKA